MELWQSLHLEVRVILQALAWIAGTWFLGTVVASLIIARLRGSEFDEQLDWNWVGRNVDAPAGESPPEPAVDESAVFSWLRVLLIWSPVAWGGRQAAALYSFVPAISFIDRFLPVLWGLAAAAAGALFVGNRILRPALPIVFSPQVRKRLDDFYPVPAGEQSFASATRVLVAWVVYGAIFLLLFTLIADVSEWNRISGTLSSVWGILLTAATIGLVWFVAVRVIQGMDAVSNEDPDGSMTSGARALGRRTLVLGIAGLITCFTLFDSAVWIIGPVLAVAIGILVWPLRRYADDYMAGIYLRAIGITTVRIAGTDYKLGPIKSFASTVIDDLQRPHQLPNAKVASAFRAAEDFRQRTPRSNAADPTASYPYTPPSDIPSASVPGPIPVATGADETPGTDPNPFGGPPPPPFNPDQEYAIQRPIAPIPPSPPAPTSDLTPDPRAAAPSP